MLLRGINVGGKNPVPMARLREVLGELGYEDVVTYIASGNVILSSKHKPDRIKREIEAALPKAFKLHAELIAVLVLTAAQLRAVVADRPKGFGDEPEQVPQRRDLPDGDRRDQGDGRRSTRATASTRSGRARASSTRSG